jgi:ABC-type phosphate transport system permease subunit
MNMKLNLVNNIGFILLAIWLIIYGVEQLFRGFRLSIGALLSILAIVAGVFILLGR